LLLVSLLCMGVLTMKEASLVLGLGSQVMTSNYMLGGLLFSPFSISLE